MEAGRSSGKCVQSSISGRDRECCVHRSIATGSGHHPSPSQWVLITLTDDKAFGAGTDRSYRGAGKSLARPGRKQARKHVRDARDFNNIETRAVIKFLFSTRQDAEGNSRHSDRNFSLLPSWSG